MVLRILMILLISIVIIFSISFLVLRLPGVQSTLKENISTLLKDQIGSEFSLSEIDLGFYKTIILRDVYIEDLQQDTLLFARKLAINTSPVNILWKEIYLSSITMDGVKINLSHTHPDSVSNFQFLIDAFSSADTSKQDTADSVPQFNIGFGKISLSDIDINMNYPADNFKLQASWKELYGYVSHFDLDSAEAGLSALMLDDAFISYQITGKNKEPKESPKSDYSSIFQLSDIPWDVEIKSFQLSNNTIVFRDLTTAISDSALNFSDIYLAPLNLRANKLYVNTEGIGMNIESLGILERNSSFEIEQFATEILIDKQSASLSNFVLKTPNSLIRNSTSAEYSSFNAFADIWNSVYINSTFYDGYLGLSDIGFFAPHLQRDSILMSQNISFSGIFLGSLNNLRGQQIFFQGGDSTILQSNFSIKHLEFPDSIHFNVEFDTLNTHYNDLKNFFPHSLPENLKALGAISFEGLIEGNLSNISADGQLISDAGSVRIDAVSALDSAFTHGTYKGEFFIDALDVGQLLNNESLGLLTMDAVIDGEGLEADSLSVTLDANIQSVSYNDYEFKDILINGLYELNKFQGAFEIGDDNITAQFNGLVDISDSIPIFNFHAHIDTINFMSLNLMEDSLSLSANIQSNFRGDNLDDLNGTASVTDLYLSKSSKTFHEDSIILLANQLTNEEKTIYLTSDLFKASLVGSFNIAKLPNLLNQFISDYFPLDRLINNSPDSFDTNVQKDPESSYAEIEENFTFNIEANNLTRLTRLFDSSLEQLDTLSISSQFNNRNKILDARLWIPNPVYNGVSLDSILFRANINTSKLDWSLGIYSLQVENSLSFQQFIFDNSFSGHKWKSNIQLLGDSAKLTLGTGFEISELAANRFIIRLDDLFYLNNDPWQLDPNHRILYHQQDWELGKTSISKDQQKLSVEHVHQDNPWQISFSNFQVEEITSLVDFRDIELFGKLNGDLSFDKQGDKQIILADLLLKELVVNGENMGDLTANVQRNSNDEIINVLTSLKGSEDEFKAIGVYDPKVDSISIEFEFNKLRLKLLETVIPDQLSDSKGYITGSAVIEGTSSQPVVNGEFLFKETSAYLTYVQTLYTFPNEKIILNENEIVFDKFNMLDAEGGNAVLNGSIRHTYFEDFIFDLSFSTNKFEFIDSEAGSNPLFYGNITLGIQADIEGPLDQITVSASARTMPNTNFTVLQTEEQEEASLKEDFIIYTTSMDTTVSDSIRPEIFYEIDHAGYTLDLILEITPEAQFTFVVDPVSGDQVNVKGSANLQVFFPPSGDLEIFGNYTLEEGSYAFSFENVLKKNFDIQPGSNISFQGDIFESRMDITAVYELRTTTYELIQNEVSSQNTSAISQTKLREEVEVLLNMRQKIFSPNLSFDIQVPGQEGGSLTNPVSQQLTKLRQNPSELNKQVFGLLLFGSFISSNSQSNTSALGGLENAAISSVSRLISQQLNKLADKYIQGVTINLNFDSYRADLEGDSRVSEVQLGVSKQLFNERITVEVEGDLQVSNNETLNNNSDFSGIAGNFILKYKITEDGRYNLRVFRRNNQNGFFDASGGSGNSIQTGVGVSYQKSFN